MSNLKNIVFPLLGFCLLCYPLAFARDADTMFQNYHIHITNNLPPSNGPSLLLHCKSKNVDLGDQTMSQNDDFTWDAQIDLFRRALFFCNARWVDESQDAIKKQISFDAFKATRDERRCEEYHNSCLWSVRTDGIYFSSNMTYWYNAYPW